MIESQQYDYTKLGHSFFGIWDLFQENSPLGYRQETDKNK